MSLGENIAYLRRQRSMTQEALAERMDVTRQTVSRWETDDVTPDLDKIIGLCALFSCKMDSLVREDLSFDRTIYSDVILVRVPRFRASTYVVISPDPESDAIGRMKAWAEENGLSSSPLIGWDFPFVSQEEKHRFGFHGYEAAVILPSSFECRVDGVAVREMNEATYGVVTIKNPMIEPFRRIPKAYRIIMDYLEANGCKGKVSEDTLSCFEYEYTKDGTPYMDVYVCAPGAVSDTISPLFT